MNSDLKCCVLAFILDDDIVKEEENLHKMTLAKEEETKHLVRLNFHLKKLACRQNKFIGNMKSFVIVFVYCSGMFIAFLHLFLSLLFIIFSVCSVIVHAFVFRQSLRRRKRNFRVFSFKLTQT